MADDATGVIAQDSRNLALLIWVGTIPLGFIPGLIVYLTKKDDPFLLDHAKESLNWSITAMIAYMAGFILTFVVIGVLVFFALAVCHLAFCVMGAVAASNGGGYRTPIALRLIK